VLRDLDSSGSLIPDIRDEQWSDIEAQLTVMLCGPDGSGQGVSAMAAEPSPQDIVADQVQEWAVEALWSIGQTATWPECPAHPNSHPLQRRCGKTAQCGSARRPDARWPASGNCTALAASSGTPAGTVYGLGTRPS
jgi:hypothetical protein